MKKTMKNTNTANTQEVKPTTPANETPNAIQPVTTTAQGANVTASPAPVVQVKRERVGRSVEAEKPTAEQIADVLAKHGALAILCSNYNRDDKEALIGVSVKTVETIYYSDGTQEKKNGTKVAKLSWKDCGVNKTADGKVSYKAILDRIRHCDLEAVKLLCGMFGVECDDLQAANAISAAQIQLKLDPNSPTFVQKWEKGVQEDTMLTMVKIVKANAKKLVVQNAEGKTVRTVNIPKFKSRR